MTCLIDFANTLISIKRKQFYILYFLLYRSRLEVTFLLLLLAQVHIFSVAEDQVYSVGEISTFFFRCALVWLFYGFRSTYQIVQDRTFPVAQHDSVLQLLLNSFIFFFLGSIATAFGFFILYSIVLANVVVKIFETRTIKFPNLFKSLLQLYKFELRQIFMQILWYRFPCRLKHCVPVFPIIVARQRKFVHDKIILHVFCNIYNYCIDNET